MTTSAPAIALNETSSLDPARERSAPVFISDKIEHTTYPVFFYLFYLNLVYTMVRLPPCRPGLHDPLHATGPARPGPETQVGAADSAARPNIFVKGFVNCQCLAVVARPGARPGRACCRGFSRWRPRAPGNVRHSSPPWAARSIDIRIECSADAGLSESGSVLLQSTLRLCKRKRRVSSRLSH